MKPVVREAVFTALAQHDERERARYAHAAAARPFLVSAAGREVWGWRGRPLGRRAGDCRPRVLADAVDQAGGRLRRGLLHARSLAAPATAARIRRAFVHVHVLDPAAGPGRKSVALDQLPQGRGRGVHSARAPLIARRAEQLTGTPVPAA
ncbi:hypothetical protein ACWEL8_26665 [Streptomyces sp. NPDC004690]